MDNTQFFALLDRYDDVWLKLHEHNVAKLTPTELRKDKGDGFLALFQQASELSFALIEEFSVRSGSHEVPLLDDNRLDTKALRAFAADKVDA